MATATARKPQTLRLREDTRQPGPCRVDREKGVIFDVKVCGRESANKRAYLPECFRDAVQRKLYEGAKVHADHPLKAGEQRPVRGLLGKLTGIYDREGELYAKEFHILKSHPLAESVFEDCERGLGVYGLSHNAEAADWEVTREGVQQVKRLARVESVDLVSDPATNSNLWESTINTPKKITITALLEQLSSNAKLPKPVRKALLEMDGMDGCTKEMDEPTDAPAASTADPLALLAQAAAALAASGDAAQHEMGMKIMKLLKPESAETPEADDEDGEGDGDDGDDEKKPFESKKKGGRTARKPAAPRPAVVTEARAKALIALAGVTESRELLDAVCGIDETRAISVIQLAKGKQTQAAPRGPRSAPAGTVSATATVTESKIPDDSKALASWLNGK